MTEPEALRAYAQQTYQKSLHALAYGQIANLFTAFTFFVRGGAEQTCYDLLWSKREDIAYVSAGQGYRGRAAVHAWFVERRETMRREKLPMLAALYPQQVKNDDAFLGAGDYDFHILSTPHIRVANDNQTAKGAWWAPGVLAETDQDGQLRTTMTTINYGCDFIFEDGAWKIWHLREFQEFSCPLDSGILDMTQAAAAGTTLQARDLALFAENGAPKSNLHRSGMEPVTRTRVSAMLPDLAAPYETWDDSMSCIRELGKEAGACRS